MVMYVGTYINYIIMIKLISILGIYKYTSYIHSFMNNHVHTTTIEL
jgi:hypothetical protein